MPRPALKYHQYLELAKRKGLEYNEPEGFTPRNARTVVKWKCKLTGHKFTKAYQRVKDAEFGTRYQRDFPNNMRRYYELSKILGIEFVYVPRENTFPKNTKTKAMWKGSKDESEVYASFHELAYNAIPERLIEDLGLSPDVRDRDIRAELQEVLNG